MKYTNICGKDFKNKSKAYKFFRSLVKDTVNTGLNYVEPTIELTEKTPLKNSSVNNMFGESQSTEGTFELEGNIISYKIEDGMITLTVVDADGNETIIQLPLGDFSF